MAKSGAYDANNPAFQASQAVGGVTRDIIAVIGGGGVGTVGRAEGLILTAGQRFMLGEFGPSLSGLLTSSGSLSTASLMADYILKWGGRIDSYYKIKNAFGGDDAQPCNSK